MGSMLKKWQKRLGLSDWTIVLKDNALPSEMTLPDVVGESEWTESVKSAVIRILREDCYGNRIRPYDYKETLIHELLHLKFCLLSESGNDLQDRYVHQLIDDLARAFVEAEEGERE